ncbi:MAG: anhydro-N-acetylmuramic acid kinase, partial [Chitinophagaceae bacterium]|nr:anhydro-N-acetylmuramic acid kinase [Chitinophagaceae bacterium]
MIYKAIGVMSGSSLDGLDLVYVHFHESAGKWSYEIVAGVCYEYPEEWVKKLKNAVNLSALEYQLLHSEYGHFLGRQINKFIESYELNHK